MSLKAIEMQVALPRTYDAGKLQEQQDQKHQQMYSFAAKEAGKEEERKRITVIKGEGKGKVNSNKKGDKHLHEQTRSEEKKEFNEIENTTIHPYKGQSIDFSG
ncbi:hypothetical protein ACTQ5K_07080 [Niallia sp. Sow4_A1]|jgi:hypothetical protein|uniref:Uncharacterized protein n=1 Tax=Niallia hominis TaxID=3133173 RepID=A0ABV1ESP7_9BACI|nr:MULTISPECIES: hypothetical protein [Bacillaceae]MCF2646549.1 hypothetical protein [Niallia circulans]MCM3361550.1 hypothetical protein [Niallia sp. MER TA 168]